MTDSTQVFRPGDRISDENGAVSPGAILNFYVAGTSTPLEVFSDRGLTSSLGTSVVCDSAGYPSASNVRVLVYTGSAAYKIICTDADAVTMWTHDDIAGAVDTSAFITSDAGTITYTVTPVSTTGTWIASDVIGTLLTADSSGGSFVRTLPAASACTGSATKVQHVGTSGIVSIKAAGSDKIYCDGIDTARAVLFLMQRGDAVELISDGVDWHASTLSVARAPRFFAVEDRRTAPAASPTVGLAYLLNGVPSGAFTSTSPACAANDIVTYDGQSNYQIFRPTSDCGWLVYDKSADTMLQYRGSTWQPIVDVAATQAQQEAGSSTTAVVTSGRQHYHPSAAKAWGSFVGSTGVINASYNTTSITRAGTGQYTINHTAGFSSGNYSAVIGSSPSGSAVFCGHAITSQGSTTCSIRTYGVTSTPTVGAIDPTTVTYALFGDF
jgi:hypothetical protein